MGQEISDQSQQTLPQFEFNIPKIETDHQFLFNYEIENVFDFVLKNAKMKHGKKKIFYDLKKCCQAKIIGVQTILLDENEPRKSLSEKINSSLYKQIESNPKKQYFVLHHILEEYKISMISAFLLPDEQIVKTFSSRQWAETWNYFLNATNQEKKSIFQMFIEIKECAPHLLLPLEVLIPQTSFIPCRTHNSEWQKNKNMIELFLSIDSHKISKSVIDLIFPFQNTNIIVDVFFGLKLPNVELENIIFAAMEYKHKSISISSQFLKSMGIEDDKFLKTMGIEDDSSSFFLSECSGSISSSSPPVEEQNNMKNVATNENDSNILLNFKV